MTGLARHLVDDARRIGTLPLGAIAAFAFALRVAWAQYSPAATAAPRFDDTVFYYHMAQNIADGTGYVHPVSGLATAQWPPGYPAFLAAIFKTTGASVTAGEFANAILAAMTAVLVAVLARRLGAGRFAARAAAVLFAAAPGSIMMAGVLASETLFTCLFVFGLVVIAGLPSRDAGHRRAAIALLAAVTGAAALTREAGLSLLPIAGVYWGLSLSGVRRTMQYTGALAILALCVVAPWTIRNYIVLDSFVLVSSSAAGNFFEGHQEEVDGRATVDIVAGYGPLWRPGGEIDVNRAAWNHGWDYLRTHPLEELRAPFTKTRTLYQGDQGGLDWNDVYGSLPFMSDGERRAFSVTSDVAWYMLLALAGAGLVASGRRGPATRLLAPAVLFWTLGHVAFFTDPRFHLPLVPLFAAAGGIGLAGVARLVARAQAPVLRPSPLRARLAVGAAAAPALAGAVLLAARLLEPSTTTESRTLVREPPPGVIYAREICSFSNDDARAALVQGADGGASVVVGGRTWWMFGDTLFFPESGKQIEQNSVAWSDSFHPGGCPKLEYYAPEGVALPFLAKDGSLTVWPAGAWPHDEHSFDFFTAYVYGTGPYAYWIGELGVARFDTGTQQTTVLARSLWGMDAGFPSQVIGTQPVEIADDGLLRIVLHTLTGSKLLARVAPGAMQDPGAYEYWDGGAWTQSTAAAATIWQPVVTDDPVQKLARFENGASIAWNEALGKYVALLNTGFSSVGARTADRLEGPWSEPQPWVDCLAFAEPRVPACYSPQLHPQLASAGSRRIVGSISAIEPYGTTLYEFIVGTPVHEYHDGDGVVYGAAPPGEGWRDDGVAFYASTEPMPGLRPVYRWQRGDESQYGIEAPGDGSVRGDLAFYAAPAEAVTGSAATYRPVYDWHDGSTHLLSSLQTGLEEYGYARGAIAFYAP